MIINLDPCIFSWGPVSFYWYGLCIATALGIYSALITHDAVIRRYRFPADGAIAVALLCAIVGARLVHVMTDYHSYAHWSELLLITRGGLSMWGGVVGVLLAAWYQVKPYSARWTILDRFALYAPWLHVVSRIGCLLAGCCHGVVDTSGSWWSIVYTHPDSLASVLGCSVIPTQLYSSVLFVVLGIILWAVQRYVQYVPGSLLYGYVIGVAIERWCVDWWRGDRIWDIPVLGFTSTWWSFHQWMSFIICLGALIGLGVRYRGKR